MAESILTVSDLTADISELLEGNFHGIWVEGEVSNLRRPNSGHQYFTLKDEFAQLPAVFFRGAAAKNPVELRDGLKVQLFGNLSVYEARGQYQLVVQKALAHGTGDLQRRFEELKQRLQAEGLFDADRKKALPAFPNSIGIVTSETGAALQDMLNVFGRRAPWLKLSLIPVRVQGEGAAQEVSAALAQFNECETRPDLIIIARGGGSIEDLWAFNEEPVARAVAASEIPVISGVGHEIDFTICDFSADYRAPTPSAAAEYAAPDGAALTHSLSRLRQQLMGAVEQSLQGRATDSVNLRRTLVAHAPERVIESQIQSNDFQGERLQSAMSERLQRAGDRLAAAGDRLQRAPIDDHLTRIRERIDHWHQTLQREVADKPCEMRDRLQQAYHLLQTLGPQATTARGFAMITAQNGDLITSTEQLPAGTEFETHLSDGKVKAIAQG